MKRVWLSWSSGKDSAWTAHVLRQQSDVELVGLLTTVNEAFDRVAMHAVRSQLLARQAEALGLPVEIVRIPNPCPNDVYERRMADAIDIAGANDVTHIAFGDLFLEDIRAYREGMMKGTGIEPLFPIWGEPTRALSRTMVEAGLRAVVTCIDPKKLERSFAGRVFDGTFLDDLPDDVDPCAERGEFHTFAFSGPMFDAPIDVEIGEVVDRDGFTFADVTEATS